MRLTSRPRAGARLAAAAIALALALALVAGVTLVARLPAEPIRSDGPFAVVALVPSVVDP
ncbi:MAG: hypothetical protein QJR08_00505 [Bacillota bacterium]|nr:hypothetical protein [Bacillota bacterium]